MGVQVSGLKQLTADLKKFDEQAPKKIKAVGKDAAQIIVDAAKPKAPVKTGKLQRSLKALPTAAQLGPLVYAPPIHFGWRGHNIKPNPFLYEAADERRDEVIAKYEEAMANLIDKTFHTGVGA